MKYVLWGIVTTILIKFLINSDSIWFNMNRSDNAVLDMVNQIRVENGLPPVSYNARLGRSAMAKACDMRDRDYITHVSPEGKLWEFFYDAGYVFKSAGENLAKDCIDNDCVTLWMQSPKHKANILDPRFKEGATSRCGDSLVLHLGTRLTLKEKFQILIFRLKIFLTWELLQKSIQT